MGDHLKKVQPGDPMAIPAETFNAFIDATRDFQARQSQVGAGATPRIVQTGIALVRNDGSDAGRFGVVGITGPLIAPSDNADEFKSRPMLAGGTPAAEHAGRFAVFQEPVAAGAIGRAVLSGLTIVQIDVLAADHEYADVKPADATQLASAPAGAARIVWKQDGTGTKWAVVNVGAGHGPILWGKATTDWVNDGTATGNGCYVEVNPCDRDGANADTATTNKVWLPRNGRREDPNVRQDDVIAYEAEQAGNYANPSGCLDGKVGESVRIFVGAVADIPAGWEAFAAGKYLAGRSQGHTYFGTVGNTFGVESHRHALADDIDVADYPDNTTVNQFSPHTGYTLNDEHFPPSQVVVWIKRTS